MTPLFVLLALAAEPVLDIPPEAVPPEAPSLLPQLGTTPDDAALLRGLQDLRLATEGTVVGGYGQLNGSATSIGPGPNGEMLNTPSYQATVRRLVLFVSHRFPTSWGGGPRVYTELEWENAVACRSCLGTAEVEQAFVEWPVLVRRDRELLNVRGGLRIVPIGVLNQWHEPPVFLGVERARLEEGGLIPSTWRELGAGISGAPLPGMRYELYLTTGIDPTRLAPAGLSAARSNGALAAAQSWMVSSRVEVEPALGAVVAVSALGGDMGGGTVGAAPFFDVNGDALPLVLPLYGVEGDARLRKWGVEARALAGAFFLPNSGDLMQARRADGSLLFPVAAGKTGALPTRMLGCSLELGYDVLALLRFVDVTTDQQLVPFFRLELTDGQSAVPEGFARDPFYDVKELTVGAVWRPLPQIVVKADAQARNRRLGFDEAQANVGLGFMF